MNIHEYAIVSRDEMDRWPVDMKRGGERSWASVGFGEGKAEDRRYFNWNIWPCRAVFDITECGDAVRGEVFWRRSGLSIRMKGLKIISASTKEEVKNARVAYYSQDKAVVDFEPVSGKGIYYLYFGAAEQPLFDPDEQWLKKADDVSSCISSVRALRIEARCALDNLYPMEVVALKDEVDGLLSRFPDKKYMVFPEDRDRPVKLHLEIPAHWVSGGCGDSMRLTADRNEYRVFQLGIWSCREDLKDIEVETSPVTDSMGNNDCLTFKMQCLTLHSEIKSKYIKKPNDRISIPKGQVRALWFGVDIPENAVPGEYRGTLKVMPAGIEPQEIQIIVEVSGSVVADKGEHDLWRLSRLRWLESDIGLSDKVYAPYKPLSLSEDGKTVTTWGHRLVIDDNGMPARLLYEDKDIMAGPMRLEGVLNGKAAEWKNSGFKVAEKTEGHINWNGYAESGDLKLNVSGSIEYDGCIAMTLELSSAAVCRIDDLKLMLPWNIEFADLASGMGYRGRRDGNHVWRSAQRGAKCFDPAIWMGSAHAGMAFVTWATGAEYDNLLKGSSQKTSLLWEDISREDAGEVTESGNMVLLRLNLGTHEIDGTCSWKIDFAIRPTPVKPVDLRHWQFRYVHRGGGFRADNVDTPHSYLKDGCKRLDEVKELGVKRLNLHDWWGPAFNYPWQWDRADNLSKLTEEAHKRGLFVKVYNSGREASTLAPEFWPLVMEGSGYRFCDSYDPDPKFFSQDAWHESHMPDGMPWGWPRLHDDYGNEHAVAVSNATRVGNFYLESMRYMTQHFGTDGAYWDGADGSTMGHREMAKRLWTMFREMNPNALIDAHHGDSLVTSPICDYILCFPFTDSIWHGEGFDYSTFDPWAWLVEISGIPFGQPSEMLGGDKHYERGMLFGIWPRAGWCAETEIQRKLWDFFDKFGIQDAKMYGFWEKQNGMTLDRPNIYSTAFAHPENGVLLAIASWHEPLAEWLLMKMDVTVRLDRKFFGLEGKKLSATDIMTGEEVDMNSPVVLSPTGGRLVWIKHS